MSEIRRIICSACYVYASKIRPYLKQTKTNRKKITFDIAYERKIHLLDKSESEIIEFVKLRLLKQYQPIFLAKDVEGVIGNSFMYGYNSCLEDIIKILDALKNEPGNIR